MLVSPTSSCCFLTTRLTTHVTRCKAQQRCSLCASYGLVFMSHLLRRTGKSFSMTVMCHVRVYVCVWSSTSDGPNSARTPTRTVTHHAQHSHALAEPPGRKKKRPQTAGRVAGRTALAQPHTSTTNILSLFSHNSTNKPMSRAATGSKDAVVCSATTWRSCCTCCIPQ